MKLSTRLTDQQATGVAEARTVTSAMPSGTYDGAELRPFTGRAAALDALAKPSRMFNRLHYRDGRVERIADKGADA